MNGDGYVLADFADVIMGQSPPGDTVNEDGVGLPLLNGPTEFTFSHPVPSQYTVDVRKRAQRGDILFCVRGSTTGRMNWADRDYAIGRGIAAIRPKAPGTAPAIRALLELALPALLPTATGSTFPNVGREQLERISARGLTGSTLAGVSIVIGVLDDKIERNRRMAETLESIARGLFKNWFVDFEPVRAKAEGRTISLPGEIAGLFPERFGEDGLPEGWTKEPTSTLLENVVARVHPSEATAARPYVPIDSIFSKKLCTVEGRPGREAQSSLVGFRRDDILFGAMRPYFHKVCIAPYAGTTRTTVFVLRPRRASDLAYSLLVMSEDSTIEFATNSASGSTIPYAVWEGSLANMPIVVPPLMLRSALAEAVMPAFRRVQASVEESHILTALRDTLLPKLICGELRAADAEKRIAVA